MRIAGMVALMLAAAAGCTLEGPVEPSSSGGGMYSVGAGGAETSRARAMYVSDEIELLQKQRADVLRRRGELLRHARECKRKASEALSDRRLALSERKPHSLLHTSKAEKLEKEAANMLMLKKGLDKRISDLDTLRRDLIRQAGRYDDLKAAGPK